MTHRDKSTLRGDELLASGGEVDHGDAMRRLLEAGLQELIEAEVAVKIGAGRYERSADRERVPFRCGLLS
jgi:transposase-like protein